MNTEFFGMNSNEVKLNNPAIPLRVQELDARARRIANTYLGAESEMISVLQELDKCRGYLHYGVTSLIGYTIEVLKLSEGAASNLVTVARKSVEFPALKAAVEAGEVTISKARRIAAVLTTDNHSQWIDLAKTSTSRVIEKEVARANPQASVPERLKYKSAERLELCFGISEQLSEKLTRVKDLLAQQRSKTVKSEEALEALVDNYLERHDPIKKAERAKVKLEKRGENLAQGNVPHGTGRVDNFWMSCGKDGELFQIKELKSTPSNEDHEFDHLSADDLRDVTIRKGDTFPLKRSARTNLPAVVKHAVTLRDQRQCTFVHRDGKRCVSTRWLDVHHVIRVADGGSNELKNLTTLCSAHHRLQH